MHLELAFAHSPTTSNLSVPNVRISVIIPCYNAEPYVAQTIRSVLEQTRPADEVIVVDDGSTDGSVEEVRQFGDRIRLLTGRNGGASPTRNKGLAHATGEALMFLDADDVLGPRALEALVDALRPGTIAACPWYRLEEEGGKWVRRPASCASRRGRDPLAGWLSGWYHPPCSVLWSREAFDVVGQWDGRGGPNDDGHVMMQALARGVPLMLTDEGSAFYRRLRPDDAPSVSSRRFTPSGLEARLWVLEQLGQTLEEEGRLEEYHRFLDGALARLVHESEGEHPELVENITGVARRYAGYPWVRRVRRVREALGKASLAAYRIKSRIARRIRPQALVRTEPSAPWGQEVRFGLNRSAHSEDAPLVSVIIPTYNRAHLLPRALESVLGQTLEDFEVLIVDDGSTDDTADLVERYAAEDGRVCYLRQPANRGVSAARNRGLREARGEFVAFLDSDDEWFPSKLKKQVDRFRQVGKGVGLIYCGVETIDPEGDWVFRPEDRGDVYERLLLQNVIHTGSGVMIRRDVVRVAGFFDEGIPAIEDYDYWVRIARHFEFDYVEDPLLRYFYGHGEAQKSLSTHENLDARAWFFRKHEAEMRRADVDHLFLLESMRRHLGASDARGARWLALQAVRHRPLSYETYSWLLYMTLPEKVFQWVRKGWRASRQVLRGFRKGAL
jgi:glycosyltransferase involved in cell wall biosynthesis